MTAPSLMITVLDAEVRQQILAFADTAPFTIIQAMTHLKIGRFLAQTWLDELIDAGELQHIYQSLKGHGAYQRIVVDLAFVNEAIMPEIQRMLAHRPALPGTIAAQLGLELREVQRRVKPCSVNASPRVPERSELDHAEHHYSKLSA